MSAASFRAAAELPDRDEACQPDYRCAHCQGPARGAVAVTLTPWDLSEPALAGWLCGSCADELREWLGDEVSP